MVLVLGDKNWFQPCSPEESHPPSQVLRLLLFIATFIIADTEELLGNFETVHKQGTICAFRLKIFYRHKIKL